MTRPDPVRPQRSGPWLGVFLLGLVVLVLGVATKLKQPTETERARKACVEAQVEAIGGNDRQAQLKAVMDCARRHPG